MPIFPPRIGPIKKREQLLLREKELQLAVKATADRDKIIKLVKKYRLAQLSFHKAKLHELREKTLQNKSSTLKIEKIEKDILGWTSITDLEIITDIKTSIK